MEHKKGARRVREEHAQRPGLGSGLARRLMLSARAEAFRDGRVILLHPLERESRPLTLKLPLPKPPDKPLADSRWDDPDVPCPWKMDPT